MSMSSDFYLSTFNAMPEHIAILDEHGTIQATNTAWNAYADTNGGILEQVGTGTNYLATCDKSAKAGISEASMVARNIRDIIGDRTTQFCLDYPCHSPTEKKWYEVKGWSLLYKDQHYLVISHQDVTRRAHIREELESLAYTDGLTGVSNRRHFDKLLSQEWRRDMRKKTPLSIILLDIDFFKLFNDQYGHVAGDDCLKRVGTMLKTFAKRPGDLAVRYGGEEFILLLGSTPAKAAKQIADNICQSIRDLEIPHRASSVSSTITVSLGVVSMTPTQGLSETMLLPLADQALYTAKNDGRNSVSIASIEYE